MEVLTSFFKNLDEMYEYFSRFLILCHDHPLFATLLAFPIIFYLGYICISQIIQCFQWVKAQIRNTQGKIVIAICMFLSLFGSYFGVLEIRISQEPKPILTFQPVVIGTNLSLSWDYQNLDNGETKFQIESAKDVFFKNGLKLMPQCPDGNLFNIPQSINDTRYWRVRAGKVENGKFVPISLWSDPAEISQYDSCLERIKRTHVINICTSKSFNQGFFKFTNGYSSAGLDIDFANLIAKSIGKKLHLELLPKITSVPWNELFDTPSEGKADFIISSISIRPERETQYHIQFSKPYYQTTLALLYRQDRKVRSAMEALKGSKVGVMESTTGEIFARTYERKFKGKNKIKVIPYDQNERAVEELLKNSAVIDCVIVDTPFAIVAKEMNNKNNSNKLNFTEFNSNDYPKRNSQFTDSEQYAVAVRSSETELLKYINETISSLDPVTLKAMEEKAKSEFEKTIGDQN